MIWETIKDVVKTPTFADYLLYYIIFCVFCGAFWTLCKDTTLGWPLYIVGVILYTNAWQAPAMPLPQKELTDEAPVE